MQYDTKCIWEQHLKPAAPVFADVPNDLPSSRYVKSIGAGGYHLLVVTVSPTAGYQSWASGLNNYGQLGVGDHDNRDVLTPITAFSGMNILAMDGGMHHSAAIAADGTLFAFGRGDSGQLGVTDEMVRRAVSESDEAKSEAGEAKSSLARVHHAALFARPRCPLTHPILAAGHGILRGEPGACHCEQQGGAAEPAGLRREPQLGGVDEERGLLLGVWGHVRARAREGRGCLSP